MNHAEYTVDGSEPMPSYQDKVVSKGHDEVAPTLADLKGSVGRPPEAMRPLNGDNSQRSSEKNRAMAPEEDSPSKGSLERYLLERQDEASLYEGWQVEDLQATEQQYHHYRALPKDEKALENSRQIYCAGQWAPDLEDLPDKAGYARPTVLMTRKKRVELLHQAGRDQAIATVAAGWLAGEYVAGLYDTESTREIAATCGDLLRHQDLTLEQEYVLGCFATAASRRSQGAPPSTLCVTEHPTQVPSMTPTGTREPGASIQYEPEGLDDTARTVASKLLQLRKNLARESDPRQACCAQMTGPPTTSMGSGTRMRPSGWERGGLDHVVPAQGLVAMMSSRSQRAQARAENSTPRAARMEAPNTSTRVDSRPATPMPEDEADVSHLQRQLAEARLEQEYAQQEKERARREAEELRMELDGRQTHAQREQEQARREVEELREELESRREHAQQEQEKARRDVENLRAELERRQAHDQQEQERARRDTEAFQAAMSEASRSPPHSRHGMGSSPTDPPSCSKHAQRPTTSRRSAGAAPETARPSEVSSELARQLALAQMERAHMQRELSDAKRELNRRSSSTERPPSHGSGEAAFTQSRPKAILKMDGIEVGMKSSAYVAVRADLKRALLHNIKRCQWSEEEALTHFLRSLPLSFKTAVSRMGSIDAAFDYLDRQFLHQTTDLERDAFEKSQIGARTVAEYYNELETLADRLNHGPDELARQFVKGLEDDYPDLWRRLRSDFKGASPNELVAEAKEYLELSRQKRPDPARARLAAFTSAATHDPTSMVQALQDRVNALEASQKNQRNGPPPPPPYPPRNQPGYTGGGPPGRQYASNAARPQYQPDPTPLLTEREVEALPWLSGSVDYKGARYMAIRPANGDRAQLAHVLSRFVPPVEQEPYQVGEAVEYKVQKDSKGLRVLALRTTSK